MRSFWSLFCLSILWCVVSCTKSDSPSPETATEVATVAPSTAPAAAPSTEPTTDPAAVPSTEPTTDPAAVPSQAAAPLRTALITFVPSELVAGNVDGAVKHCLNCQIRARTYEYCHFEVNALHAAVGKERLSSEITAKVSMAPLSTENYKPADPNAPQPEGGFVKDAFTCLVLEVEPAK